MNLEKAREYFSSYREGSLDGGIKVAFEQRLRSDVALQAEYESFLHAMDELDQLKFEEIPVPFYLNDRIHARLAEAKAPVVKQKGLVFYLPRFGIAAAAAVAILFAANGILRPSHSATSQANPFPVGDDTATPPLESISIEGSGAAVKIHYSSANERTVVIRDGTGAILRQDSLEPNKPFESDLKNPNSTAAVFEVQVSDHGPDEYIAVPGSNSADPAAEKSGSVVDFMKALADRYGKPVVYSGSNLSEPLSWNLTEGDAKAASDHVLDGTKMVESITSTGVLSISDR